MSDNVLKGCPFCGGPAQIIAGAPGCYYVRCEGCSVTSDDGSRERVITKWNTRHQSQREDVLEQAAKACEEQQRIFASSKYAAGQPMSSFGERFAAGRCAEAIRALKTTPAPVEEGPDLTDEQWAKALENAPKPDGPLTPIAPAAATDDLWNPPEHAWDGLARQLVMWLDMGDKTPRALFEHLERTGCEIPQWLRDEPELQHLDHVPSKGTRAVIIYRAILSRLRGEGE